MTDTQTKLSITGLGTVIVTVTNQDDALGFYRDTLGFEIRGDTAYGDGERWIEVAPEGAVTTVALVPPREGTTHEPSYTGIGYSSADIDSDHAELRSRDVDVDGEILRMGEPVPPMFWFRDPDGNSYLIVERI